VNRRFKRKQKPRQLKQTYLIVCEGFSEEKYFKDMKRLESLKNISVKVVNPSVTTPNEIFIMHGKNTVRGNTMRHFVLSMEMF